MLLLKSTTETEPSVIWRHQAELCGHIFICKGCTLSVRRSISFGLSSRSWATAVSPL